LNTGPSDFYDQSHLRVNSLLFKKPPIKFETIQTNQIALLFAVMARSPLRERKKDIGLKGNSFLEKMFNEKNSDILLFSNKKLSPPIFKST